MLDTYILTLLEPRSTQQFGSLMDKRRLVVEGEYTRKKFTSRTLVSPHTKVSIWLRRSYFTRFTGYRVDSMYDVFTYQWSYLFGSREQCAFRQPLRSL